MHAKKETGSLIEEVNAQKEALDKRITALQDGLDVPTELVDTPLDFLEEELSRINDKLRNCSGTIAKFGARAVLGRVRRKTKQCTPR